MTMALIPYVKIEDCCQALQDRFKARRPLNVSLMIANSEPVALAGQELGDALMRQAKLSPKLREMAILLNARNCGAYYEWVAHIPAAKACGVTDEQIKAIEGWWRSAKVFSDLERLVLQFTDELSRGVKGRRETVDALKKLLGPREIVELIFTIGYWGLVARLLETLEVDFDDMVGKVNVAAPTRD
jgi:4-carboxymuconolactone decarboxylase